MMGETINSFYEDDKDNADDKGLPKTITSSDAMNGNLYENEVSSYVLLFVRLS